MDGDFGGMLPVDSRRVAGQVAAPGDARRGESTQASDFGDDDRTIPLKSDRYRCGADEPLLVIAGPCVIESESLTLAIAEQLARDTRELRVQLVFKASFDKANRTSLDAYRGPGSTRACGSWNKCATRSACR